MKFIYKLNDGHTGSTESVDSLPSNIKKLIIRRYNGGDIIVPYVEELILDCYKYNIKYISFKCDKLSIYRPNIHWFHINNVWVNYDSKTSSTFNTLVRLKLECVKNTSGMLKNTLCSNITTVLDFSSVKISRTAHRIVLVPMFDNTQLKTIPKSINLPSIPYMTIFDGALIPRDKLEAADVLLTISKKGEVS